MKKEKKVILTFDYEMFLGKDSGNLYKSLIEPTKKIIDILDRNNQKAIFFVDSTFLNYINENDKDSYNIVRSQLENILEHGSFLGLHMHTQWLDAYKLEKQRWGFKTFNKYRFHSLAQEEQKNVFEKSYHELNEIITSNNYNQKKLIHFRAGGWSIQPFEAYLKSFDNYKIKYDFSVKSGFKCEKLPYHYYNYENINLKKEQWKFNIEPIKENESGIFEEFPLTSGRILGLIYLLNKIPYNKKWFGDGFGLSQSVKGYNNKNSFFGKVLKLFKLNILPFQFESYNKYFFKLFLKIICMKRNISVIVGHPKTFNNECLNNLKYICNKMKSFIPN